MAVGDQNDMFLRLKDNLVDWYGIDAPVLDALLKGCATTDAFIHSLIEYTKLQTRINTATDFYLDYIARDYFAGDLYRFPGENDPSFRKRILASLVQEKGTKKGIIEAVTTLTGRTPYVVDAMDITTGGCYDVSFFYDKGFGYSWYEPYTGIVFAFRPHPIGFYFFSGYSEYSEPVENYGYFGYVDFDTYFPYVPGISFNYGNYYTEPYESIVVIPDSAIENIINKTKVYGTKVYIFILD